MVLLLLGLVSGIELGLLRWKFLQWAPPPVILAGLRSTWRCYIKSATLWVAGVMVSGWMVTAFPSIHAADALAYAGIVVVGPGLLLIAPIPVFFSVGPAVNLGKRVWKYWLRCLSAAFGLLVLCLFAAMVLFRGPLIILYYFYSLPYLLLGFWLVCPRGPSSAAWRSSPARGRWNTRNPLWRIRDSPHLRLPRMHRYGFDLRQRGRFYW